MLGNRFAYEVPTGLQECRRRLADAIDSDWKRNPDKDAYGRLDNGHFAFRLRTSSFTCYGSIQGSSIGTKISAQIGLSPYLDFQSSGYLGMIGMFLIIFHLNDPASFIPALIGGLLFIPLALIILGFALKPLSAYDSGQFEQYLKTLLSRHG